MSAIGFGKDYFDHSIICARQCIQDIFASRSKLIWLALLLNCVGHTIPALAQEDAHIASMRTAGEVRVAMASSPPNMYLTPSGEPKGYYLEVINMALKGMGLPPMKPILTAWDAQIPALLARQVDLVAPGLQYTDARCKAVLFSAPLIIRLNALYMPLGNPKHLSDYANLGQKSDLKLAVVKGSSQETYALQQGVKPDQLIHVPDIQAAAESVIGGRADALAMGENSIVDIEQKGLTMLADKNSPLQGYGVTFRKDDLKFRDAFNQQLNVLRREGVLQKLMDPRTHTDWETLGKLTKASDVLPSCE